MLKGKLCVLRVGKRGLGAIWANVIEERRVLHIRTCLHRGAIEHLSAIPRQDRDKRQDMKLQCMLLKLSANRESCNPRHQTSSSTTQKRRLRTSDRRSLRRGSSAHGRLHSRFDATPD